MKVYISVDIEGITGVTNWNETEKNLPDWIPFAQQMSLEALAAVDGAIEAGATEIVIKDAHDSARNLDPNIFPDCVKLIRGWIGDPLSMVTTIDESYDAIMFIGYHSAGGTNFNPLSHTMNSSDISYIKINGEIISEFLLHCYCGSLYNVPVVFVSGDKGLTESVNKYNKFIKTLAVKEGIGGATINISPNKAILETKHLVKDVLLSDINLCNIELPKSFNLQIAYKSHVKAYKSSFYPNATLISPTIIEYNTTDFYEIMRAINFLT